MPVYQIDGVTPVVHPSSYVHPTAVIIGDVIIGPDCYIGPLASLRGDFGPIHIGRGVNIQDSCVVHSFQDITVVIEDYAHIGHCATLHGCHIKAGVLVGTLLRPAKSDAPPPADCQRIGAASLSICGDLCLVLEAAVARWALMIIPTTLAMRCVAA